MSTPKVRSGFSLTYFGRNIKKKLRQFKFVIRVGFHEQLLGFSDRLHHVTLDDYLLFIVLIKVYSVLLVVAPAGTIEIIVGVRPRGLLHNVLTYRSALVGLQTLPCSKHPRTLSDFFFWNITR